METWKPVPFAPAYLVSSLGKLATFKKLNWVLIEPDYYPNGYGYVRLRVGDRIQRHGIHRLVAFVFHGEAPPGKTFALHGDGDRRNNSAENLRWGDAADNGADTVKLGRSTRGVKNPLAKLNDEAAAAIRRCAVNGESFTSLANEFGVRLSAVSRVVKRETWKHVGV